MCRFSNANALAFVSRVTNSLTKKFGKNNIIVNHTGHSLGAILAEIFSTSFEYWEFARRVVSFESPGSKPIIQTMVDAGVVPKDALARAKNNCWIILSGTNIINTCNEQIAKPLRAKIPINYDVLDGPLTVIPSEYYLNYYYVIGYTFLDQHKMTKIYDFFKTGGVAWQIPGQYPVGFKKGYEAYLYEDDYNYWPDYISKIWDTHSEIRVAYKNVFSSYYEFFVKTYLTRPVSLRKSVEFDQTLFRESKENIEDDYVLVNKSDIEKSDLTI